jgi:hypothetical protein
MLGDGRSEPMLTRTPFHLSLILLLLGSACAPEVPLSGIDDPLAGPAGDGDCSEPGSCPEPGRETFANGSQLQLPGTAGILKYTRVVKIGEEKNITRIYFLIHGDGNSDYGSSTEEDRQAMAKHLPPGEGAIVAYPVSSRSLWPDFEGGKNGRVLLQMFRALEKSTGNANVRFEQFSLSGGGRVNHALLRLIDEEYPSDPEVRELVDNHLRGIHDGDSLCYSISAMRERYIKAIQRLPLARFAFIHNTSGKMSYVHSHHNTIAKTVSGKSYPFGGSLTLEDGRLRFWSAATHWTAWQGQFEKVFFGTSWGEGDSPPPPAPPAPPTPPTPPTGSAWIGEACSEGAGCQSGLCLTSVGETSFAGGSCSDPCNKLCPDQAGSPTTFCVSFDASSGLFSGPQGHCFARCDTKAYPGNGCREGYACAKLPRHGDSSVKRNVCLPITPTSGRDPFSGAALRPEPADAEGDLPNPEARTDLEGGCAVAPRAELSLPLGLLLLGLLLRVRRPR